MSRKQFARNIHIPAPSNKETTNPVAALAITDHGALSGYDTSYTYAEEIGLTLIRGFETGIEGKLHLIVLGVDNEYQLRDDHYWARQPNQDQVYYQDQVREVIKHGGYIIYAHPDSQLVPPGPYKHPEGGRGLTDEILWMIEHDYLHGIETRGLLDPARRDPPFSWALRYDLALFDVTDEHLPRDFWNASQAPVTLVFARDNSSEGVLDALWSKRTIIWQNGLLRGKETWLKPFIDASLEFKLIEHNHITGLQVANKGPIGLAGNLKIDDANGLFSVLLPYQSIVIPCDKNASTVTITWENVHNAPNQSLTTKHSIAVN